jgi:hypothetical protein
MLSPCHRSGLGVFNTAQRLLVRLPIQGKTIGSLMRSNQLDINT